MPIPMNANPETAALIGGAWPEYDESTYRADAESQRKLSGTAENGAATARNVGDRTTEFHGAAGTAFQNALHRDRSNLTTQQSLHHATASKLDNLASAIENHKVNLNAIDANYHAQKATMLAAGADPADLVQLESQARSYVGNAQTTFDAAYEGIVDTLLADADAADGKPKPAPGGVVLADSEAGEAGAPGTADGEGKEAEDGAGAPSDIESDGEAKTEAAGVAPAAEAAEPNAPVADAPVVDDLAAPAPDVPVAAEPGVPVVPAAPAAPVAGIGGVGAVPASPAGNANSTQAKDMGYATGQAATQFGAGLLSGLANQPAPGMAAAPSPYAQPGYGQQPFGPQAYGQPGFGGMPQAGYPGGYGQMNPAGALGQAVAAPLTEAGNALGQFANQTANAMTGNDTGVAGLLGEALAGDEQGAGVPTLGDGPATELKSELINTIDNYLNDDAAAQGGSDNSGDSSDSLSGESSESGSGNGSDSEPDAAETGTTDNTSGGSDEQAAEDEPSVDPGSAVEEVPDAQPAPAAANAPLEPGTAAGTPITSNPTEIADPITRLQHGAGAVVDQVATGVHNAIDGTADTARHLAGIPPVDAPAPATHTSAGSASAAGTGLSASDFGQAAAPQSSGGGTGFGGGAAPVGGAPQMMAASAPAVGALAGAGVTGPWTPPPSAPGATPHNPLQPYGSGHAATPAAPGGQHGVAPISEARVPTPPPTAAAAHAEAAAILPGLPISEVNAHQVLASLRQHQSDIRFVTPTAVGIFVRGDDTELIIATADGISYLPEGAGLPEGVRLMTDFDLPQGFYKHWSGYHSPVAKLADLSKAVGSRVGTLTLALSSAPDPAQAGVQSFVQTADQFLRLSTNGAFAPAIRGRAQSAARPTEEDRSIVEHLAHDHDISIEHYNDLASSVVAARWRNPDHAETYRAAWVRFLVCGALRAYREPNPELAGVGYAIAELRRSVAALSR